MDRIHYIYKITNKINGKVYIGQTVNAIKRWSQHKTAARNNKPTQVIHHALIKYGIENFVFEIIACCLDQNTANETETTIVKQEDSYVSINKGYNVSNGGFNAPKTEEWKRKVVATRRAKDNYKHSEETKEKIALANRGENYRGPLKPGHNIRNTGKTRFKKDQNSPNIGRKMPEHVKQILLEANRGRKLSEEHRKKLSEIRKGYGNFKPNNIPHNKVHFTDQQISAIKNDTRSSYKIAADYGVTSKVILRVKNS